MSVRRKRTRRSPAEWSVRILLAAVAALLGYLSVTFSIAQVVANQSPALAHALAPYDGRVTAALSMALSGEKATPADRRRSDDLARLALRQDPTAVTAVATLGINADLRGRTSEARRLFTYAQKLSRRDLRTQLWMIEDAVQRGDVAAALHQYDITLRVLPSTGELLFPVLAAASSERAIRSELIRTLAGRPIWGEGFINYVAGKNADPRSTAMLFVGLRHAGVPVPEGARAAAVDALLATGQLDAAWGYYAALRPNVDRRRSRDPAFTAELAAPSRLDWTALNEDGRTASIERGVFDFAVPASIDGPMLQQAQLLPPGDYRLTGRSSGIDQAEAARPYWALRCTDGRELGRVVVPNSAQEGGAFAGRFSVPRDCPAQILVLVARPSDAVAGLSGQIERAELTPVH